MECPSCHEQTDEPLSCTQCGSTFCPTCNPYWDYTSEICQGCQEYNSVAAFKDDAWTARMRRWFTEKLPAPVDPSVAHGLPWHVDEAHDGTWWLMSEGLQVASFPTRKNADYACLAANQHYQLSGLAILIYNRIREGDPWFDGSDKDCELWRSIKELTNTTAIKSKS